MDLTLDVNVELLPVEKDYKFSVELATTLNLDGTPDSGVYEQGQEKSADNRLAACDYAMHGKVFKYEQAKDSAKVYAPPPLICLAPAPAPAAAPAKFQRQRRRICAPSHSGAGCRRSVYMSFGGLLMKLVGDPRHLEEAEMGSRLYILMKRIVR